MSMRREQAAVISLITNVQVVWLDSVDRLPPLDLNFHRLTDSRKNLPLVSHLNDQSIHYAQSEEPPRMKMG